MSVLLDLCILLGCVVAALFCIWRSHVNFSKGYVRLGYIYLLLWLVACILFCIQSYLYA
jgi:hypothetical protein